ncbi:MULTISPECIES: SUMF1/EgtB/PvdO family nonheme iron enzyme [unclassified Dysgonomonas]|uniref:type IX secretion system lipoprotein PorK/GldK n=1 Tax=unclassified Dysgonomonas TaxID=2630389 RepID=UPI002474B159|nr:MULTISPECIES: SUMF1/EgtB/PvdO family nonheme iron enzyme [unclassified Dysgonomonas]
MKNIIVAILGVIFFMASCGAPSGSSSSGGELIGSGGSGWAESSPYGMVLVSRGAYDMGPSEIDSLWGISANSKGVSVDNFWMDDTEITNSEYRQFVYWVRDSIIRERLADPNYGNDETYKITEDRYGDPVTPHLNWRKAIPWKKPNEDEERAILSITAVNPITGARGIDNEQMNFKYEWFDHTEAAKRRNRLNPAERNLNTDIPVDLNEVVMISKDTAYIDENGVIVNQTVTRPLGSLFDFLHTRIVNIYPDTTCWVNDFKNAYNEPYMRLYFSHPGYNDYPVVGLSWEQANAFCQWRTMYYRMGQGDKGREIEPYRLPTAGEWEFAARNGKTEYKYPWDVEGTMTDKGCFMANFKPGEGNYTKDGNLITSRVGTYSPNVFGLYDMAGNVAEWTSTTYTESGVLSMNDVNPQYQYNAAKEDPYAIKKKVVKGGSWKDVGMFIRADLTDSEYQNQPRSYIGFRCVRSQIGFAKAKR